MNKYKSSIKIYLERHSEECTSPPDWKVYGLYPTDRPDLDPDLNQNRIGLFLSRSQLFHNLLKYRALDQFCPHLSMVKNHFWNSRIQIWIFTKSHQFVLVLHQTSVSSESIDNFLRYSVLRHRQTWVKHNLRPPSVVEVNLQIQILNTFFNTSVHLPFLNTCQRWIILSWTRTFTHPFLNMSGDPKTIPQRLHKMEIRETKRWFCIVPHWPI